MILVGDSVAMTDMVVSVCFKDIGLFEYLTCKPRGYHFIL